jgi:H+/gluconate symporter-like permease
MGLNIGRKSIGLGLGVAMAVFVALAAFQGIASTSSAIPPQSAYGNSNNNSGLPVADYAVIGIVIAVVVAGILYFMFFANKGGSKPSEDEETESSEDEKSEDSTSEDDKADESSEDFKEDNES